MSAKADRAALAVCAAVVIGVPIFGTQFWLFTAGNVAAFALVVTGLNVMVGYAGQLNFASAVFMACGAYAQAVLTVKHGWQPWLALGVGAALSMAVAVVVGYHVLKLHGHYFAVATFSMGLVALGLINGADDITGGVVGIAGIPSLSLLGIDLSDPMNYYVFAWVLVGFAVLAVAGIRSSRTGRALRAIATREDVAESLGIEARRYKVVAFVISALLASLGGALMVQFSSFVSPDLFNADVTILVFAMLFIGGVATSSGPIIGAAVVVSLPAVLTGLGRGEALTFQGILLAILILCPAGLSVGAVSVAARAIRAARKDASRA